MSMLRLTLIALLAASSLPTGARACNEECAMGFVFDDTEGICVRASVSS